MLEVGSLLATIPSSQQQDMTEKEPEGLQPHTDGEGCIKQEGPAPQ